MSYDMKKSGERIRQLRIDNELTQEQAAEALNISRTFYSRVETGEKGCSIDLFVQISNLFHVSLDYLILGKYSNGLMVNTDRAQMKKDITALVVHLNQFQTAL